MNTEMREIGSNDATRLQIAPVHHFLQNTFDPCRNANPVDNLYTTHTVAAVNQMNCREQMRYLSRKMLHPCRNDHCCNCPVCTTLHGTTRRQQSVNARNSETTIAYICTRRCPLCQIQLHKLQTTTTRSINNSAANNSR